MCHAISRHVPDFDQNYRHKEWADLLVSTGDLSQVTYTIVSHVVPMTAKRFLDLWRSHKRINAGAALLDELTDYLADRSMKTVGLPYLCVAWTAR
jgi:hypothetical protein